MQAMFDHASKSVMPIRDTTPVSEQGRADFFDTLYYSDVVVGLNTSTMIEAAILRKPVLTFTGHYCLGYRLDDLVELPGLPFPTHLKIDVDGGELDVLLGAQKVLRDERCTAAQIEVTDPVGSRARRDRVMTQMRSAGFE